jgi:hypothetical protein
VIRTGATVTDVARCCEIDPWPHTWHRRYAAEGLGGLVLPQVLALIPVCTRCRRASKHESSSCVLYIRAGGPGAS